MLEWCNVVITVAFLVIALVQWFRVPAVIRILVLCMDRALSGDKILYEGFPSQCSDVMLVLEVDRRMRTTRFRQIPRDTMAYVGPELGWDKINMSIAQVGARGTCDVVGGLLNCRIDRYAVLTIPDFLQFMSIVSGKTATPLGDLSWSITGPSISAQQAKQAVLSPEEALRFVMQRVGSDIERQERHKVFLSQILPRASGLSLGKLCRLIIWARRLAMNISIMQATRYGWMILHSNHEFEMIPTAPIYLNSFSYVLPCFQDCET